MSLDLYLEGPVEKVTHRCDSCDHTHEAEHRPTLWQTNITHNLGAMFDEAGVYQTLWRGDGLVAGQQVEKLEAALRLMEAEPERFKKHNAPNGWGLYEHAVPWLRKVVEACREYPLATFYCSR